MSTLTQRSAADSILIAHCPIALMLFRTKSTSTSEAYLHHPISLPSSHTIKVRKYILLQFTQQCLDVVLLCKTDHNIELLNLDIGRVIILTEKHTHLILEDVRALLQQKVNVSQGDPLDFCCRRDEGDEWGGHLADELFHQFGSLPTTEMDHYYLGTASCTCLRSVWMKSLPIARSGLRRSRFATRTAAVLRT